MVRVGVCPECRGYADYRRCGCESVTLIAVDSHPLGDLEVTTTSPGIAVVVTSTSPTRELGFPLLPITIPQAPAPKKRLRQWHSGLSLYFCSSLGVMEFFNSLLIFPIDRTSLFNPNLRTQTVLLFLRQLVRPNDQRFQLREHV